MHILTTVKGLGLYVSAVLSHTWALVSLGFHCPLLFFLCEDVRWRLCCVQVGARCVGAVLKSCLKARTQNIQRNDPGVYFILQLAGCKSINIENTSKCQSVEQGPG